jgi:hypothetical protein
MDLARPTAPFFVVVVYLFHAVYVVSCELFAWAVEYEFLLMS